MKESVEHALVDSLDYLTALVRIGTRPEEAKAGFRPLQKRHPGVEMQLIWEEEPYDRSIHYDTLLTVPGAGTISVSFCDDRAKPWPLRGVFRWSDADLVKVNNHVMSVDQAIACLDFIWDEANITERLVNVCLIQEELEKHPIDLSGDELQLAMDAFRRARKLHKADDTHRWIERRGITYQDLERLVASQATILKLRDQIAGERLQPYFDAHAADFDTARIARFRLPDEETAAQWCNRIRAGEIDFFQAAQEVFAASKPSPEAADFFAAVRRRDAPEEIRTSLFQMPAGAVLGPVRDENGYAVIRVLSIVPAQFDETARDAIKKMLFEEWLEERRQAAAIEWFWGTANRTARVDAAVNA